VSIYDSDDRLCSYSSVTLVEPTALATDIVRGEFIPPDALADIEQGKPWRQPPAGDGIPLIDTFEPTSLLRTDDTTTIASKVIWQEPGTFAEASCIAADLSVGPPVAGAIKGAAATPNPDLSLRFCGETALGERLTSSCTLQNIDRGLATTRIRVWHQSTLLAIGISSTTCIPFR